MTGHDEREFQMCEIAYPESEARWAIAEGGHHLCVQGLGQLAGPPEWVLVRQAVQGVEMKAGRNNADKPWRKPIHTAW